MTEEIKPEVTKEEISTPQVSINVNRSNAGDLTSVVLVTAEPISEKQLAMILQALAKNIMDEYEKSKQPVEPTAPVSGAV